MIFYKVDYRLQMESRGFSYHSSHAAALKAVKEAIKKGLADPVEFGGTDIEKITVAPTKLGILAALERHAAHPDNG